MSSMENFLQQLEKHNTERMSSQGPCDLTQPQEDNQSRKKSAVRNGSPSVNYSSEQILRKFESVGNINSYEFINNEKLQCLNFAKEGVDVKVNGSVDILKLQNVDDACDVTNVQHTLKQNGQQTNHCESHIYNLQNDKGTSSNMQQTSKLQKQDAVDFENMSTLDNYLNQSKPSIRHDSNTSCLQTDSAMPEQKIASDIEHVDVGKTHEEREGKVLVEQFENDASEELLENLENMPVNASNSEVLYQDDNKENSHPSATSDVSRQESLDDDGVQFTIPDDIPQVTGWKLDRRESGHLFWRRDSSTLNGADPRSRVKFRYDVEVCEFESRGSETEDLLEEDEEGSVTVNSEEGIQRKESSDSDPSIVTVKQPSSTYFTVLYLMALIGIAVSFLYSLLTYIFSKGHVEQTQNS